MSYEVPLVMFDRLKLEGLKRALSEARGLGRESFVFEGNEYLCAYAKYLIEYLEPKLELEKE